MDHITKPPGLCKSRLVSRGCTPCSRGSQRGKAATNKKRMQRRDRRENNWLHVFLGKIPKTCGLAAQNGSPSVATGNLSMFAFKSIPITCRGSPAVLPLIDCLCGNPRSRFRIPPLPRPLPSDDSAPARDLPSSLQDDLQKHPFPPAMDAPWQ